MEHERQEELKKKERDERLERERREREAQDERKRERLFSSTGVGGDENQRKVGTRCSQENPSRIQVELRAASVLFNIAVLQKKPIVASVMFKNPIVASVMY